MAVQPCPVNGTHLMRPAAKAVVRDPSGKNLTDKYNLGYHCACSCGEQFICEGFPHFTPPGQIGYWVAGNLKLLSNIGGVLTYQVKESAIRHTNASRMEGYRFII
ncbi:hypothetical protein M3197_17095 [Sporosarcina aquimarina]|uniref:hypothetical protein n=1 Tax=Sporosarcina aquimarina TaxID=114975 RepID=UPI002040B082|nr:hypothetical protein [Sporosarcina aquimarina]MCM3759154.1 hypothetical protein [Sporosarcina aquimarina]